MRLIISGGGTGGHIFPAISIANAIKENLPDTEILFVGALGRMEMEKVPAAGYKIVGLPVEGLKRSLSLSNFRILFKFIKSCLLARKIIKDFKPNVVVGVGGYASLPTLWSAENQHIPVIIQEQNSFAGIANRLLGKRASKICVAYDNMERFFPKEKIILTGNPIRGNMVPATEAMRSEAMEFFKLSPQKRTILILGGSLGCRTLNNCMRKYALSDKENENIQIIWQCGGYYYNQELQEVAAKKPNSIQLHPFIYKMDLGYAAADLVISRSGAGSISELCATGKPCIFVPSPNVTDDHQTFNAKSLVNKDAAYMVTDATAEDSLLPLAFELCSKPEKRDRIGRNILKLAKPNAAKEIAKIVIDHAK